MCAAEVVLCNAERRVPVEAEELVVRKSYNVSTDREDYCLNGKHIGEKALFNLFESGGFNLHSASQYQVVAQGRVQSLVAQEESGFLAMLKEVTGTGAFEQRHAKMQAALADAQLKKESLGQVLREIELKLEGLSVDKETFARVEAIELRKKAYQKALYLDKIRAQEAAVSELRRSKADLMREREGLLQKREEAVSATSGQKGRLEELRSAVADAEARVDVLQRMRGDLMAKQIESQAAPSRTRPPSERPPPSSSSSAKL